MTLQRLRAPFAGGALLAAGLLAGACSSSDEPSLGGGDAAGAGGGLGVAGGGGVSDGGAGGSAGAAGSNWVPPPNYCAICVAAGSTPMANAEIDEASGLAASRVHDGVMYVHNDSGDLPRFFALDASGADLGAYSLEATVPDDPEDIAVGPCTDGSCVFIADIGDNGGARPFAVIFRLPEPSVVQPGITSTQPAQLKFSYSDGAHDAETLLVHPSNGEKVVVVKPAATEVTSGIHRLPDNLEPNILGQASKQGELSVPAGSEAFTGGDVHPLGHGIALRTYSHVWYFAFEAPDELIAEALSRSPCELPSASETKGESFAWTRDGLGYVTVSEGSGEDLHLFDCAPR